MRWEVGWRTATLAFLGFAVTVFLGSRYEPPLKEVALYSQASGESEPLAANQATQHLRGSPASLAATYAFKNFNQDNVAVSFELSRVAYAKQESSFGYYTKDLAAIDAWHNAGRQSAYRDALKNHKRQNQLDAALVALWKEHEQRVADYIASRGFRLLRGNIVAVDMPGLVKRSAPLLNPLARAFDAIAAERHYDSESLIGAATSLVQTALVYRVPPDVDLNGRHTGGILPPASALLKGWGDCDTKTVLLSSLLANWPHMRMVGIAVPEHYLLGILRIPNKGDAYVEHDGLQYILIEPAGPAWLPVGQVAESTLALLEGADGYRIDPFF